LAGQPEVFEKERDEKLKEQTRAKTEAPGRKEAMRFPSERKSGPFRGPWRPRFEVV
jgi:hypothetical protein